MIKKVVRKLGNIEDILNYQNILYTHKIIFSKLIGYYYIYPLADHFVYNKT